MTLSIVIVSYNAREHLENCLRSLFSAPPRTPFHVVVVDNASTDGSVEAVRRGWPMAQVIAEPRNRGFAGGNNVGIRATAGELVLLLNNDTIVGPGAIDTLVERLRAHPDAAVAGPLLVDAEGRVELSFGRMISPWAELRQKTMLSLQARGNRWMMGRIERASAVERYVDWVSGACLLAYRADAEAVGLLDERYFLYAEDVDFCAAIRARGRKILFTPLSRVTHLRGRSRATAPEIMNAAYRRSHVAFYEKHHPGWAPVLKGYLRLRGQI